MKKTCWCLSTPRETMRYNVRQYVTQREINERSMRSHLCRWPLDHQVHTPLKNLIVCEKLTKVYCYKFLCYTVMSNCVDYLFFLCPSFHAIVSSLKFTHSTAGSRPDVLASTKVRNPFRSSFTDILKTIWLWFIF